MEIRVQHDNGATVCLSDGSVYSREHRFLHAPDGETFATAATISARVEALLAYEREQERTQAEARARMAHPSARPVAGWQRVIA